MRCRFKHKIFQNEENGYTIAIFTTQDTSVPLSARDKYLASPIIYKVSLFYLFTFRRAGNAKTPFPCRSRQRKGVFMPGNRPGGAACKKPYFFPPGVSVLNKKKEGRCTHIWCSCHLNLFQRLCIIFLLSGTRAFQMSLRRPIWDAFSFYRH